MSAPRSRCVSWSSPLAMSSRSPPCSRPCPGSTPSTRPRAPACCCSWQRTRTGSASCCCWQRTRRSGPPLRLSSPCACRAALRLSRGRSGRRRTSHWLPRGPRQKPRQMPPTQATTLVPARRRRTPRLRLRPRTGRLVTGRAVPALPKARKAPFAPLSTRCSACCPRWTAPGLVSRSTGAFWPTLPTSPSRRSAGSLPTATCCASCSTSCWARTAPSRTRCAQTAARSRRWAAPTAGRAGTISSGSGATSPALPSCRRICASPAAQIAT
mmetsp:Transcript_267/g.810  ORF Transcript_267/g.810 Transcript_267/m.810 type:complete len:269 (-) Transcript_267:1389-2195(-)